MRGPVLRPGAVPAQLLAAHAEPENPVRDIRQRLGHGRPGRARQVGLDEHYGSGAEGGTKRGPVERADGGGVKNGDVHPLSCPEHLISERADCDDSAADT